MWAKWWEKGPIVNNLYGAAGEGGGLASEGFFVTGLLVCCFFVFFCCFVCYNNVFSLFLLSIILFFSCQYVLCF